jgi:hypothetical protein
VHSCGARVSFDIAPVASKKAPVTLGFVAGASRFGREYYRIVSDACVPFAVASTPGPVALELGTVTFSGGTFLFLAGRAAPLSGRVTLAHLLDAIVPVREIDVGGKLDYRHH